MLTPAKGNLDMNLVSQWLACSGLHVQIFKADLSGQPYDNPS